MANIDKALAAIGAVYAKLNAEIGEANAGAGTVSVESLNEVAELSAMALQEALNVYVEANDLSAEQMIEMISAENPVAADAVNDELGGLLDGPGPDESIH